MRHPNVVSDNHVPNSDKPPGWVKPTADYGPLIVFFIAYYRFDLMAATGVSAEALFAPTRLAMNANRKQNTPKQGHVLRALSPA